MNKIINIAVCVLCLAAVHVSASDGFDEQLSNIISENSREGYFSGISIEPDSTVMVKDGTEFQMRHAPMSINGTIYVSPVDFVGDFDADYSESGTLFSIKQGTMTVTGAADSDVLNLVYEDNSMFNTHIKMRNKCQRIDGVIYLPVRSMIEDVFAGSVIWRESSGSVYLTRDYQTKRLIVRVNGDVPILDSIPCKTKAKSDDGLYIIQFDADTPDYVVKLYSDFLSSQIQHVKYSDPDIVIMFNN